MTQPKFREKTSREREEERKWRREREKEREILGGPAEVGPVGEMEKNTKSKHFKNK